MTSKILKHNGVKIHIIKTDDRFRSCLCQIAISDVYTPKEWFKYYYLINLLIMNNKKYPKNNILEKEKSERYGLDVNNYFVVNPSMMQCNIYARFPNPKYTEKTELKKCLDFLFEFLNNPNIENDSFDKSTFESSIASRRVSLLNTKLNKNFTANTESEQIYSKENPLALSIEEKLEILDSLTKENVVDLYKELLTKHLEIFFIGNILEEEVLEIIKPNIKKINRGLKPKFKPLSSKLFIPNKEIVKEDNAYQTVVVINYNVLKINKKEQEVTYIVLEELLQKRLFETLREKNSLLYSFSLDYLESYKRFKIVAGIDYKNLELVKKLINQELEKIKKGKISQDQLKEIKREYKGIYYQSIESIDEILFSYVEHHTKGKLTMDKEYEEVMKVTKDEIAVLASKLKLNLIYVLKEGDNNENATN